MLTPLRMSPEEVGGVISSFFPPSPRTTMNKFVAPLSVSSSCHKKMRNLFLTVDHLRPSKPAIHSAALLEGDLARKEGGGIVGRHLKNCPVSMKSEREKAPPWCCQRHHTRTGQPLVEKNQGGCRQCVDPVD